MLTRRDTFTVRGYALTMTLYVIAAGIGLLIGNVGPDRQSAEVRSAYRCISFINDGRPCPVPDLARGGVTLSSNTSVFRETLVGMSPLNQELFVIMSVQNTLPIGVESDLSVHVVMWAEADSRRINISDSINVKQVECGQRSRWCNPVFLIHLQYYRYPTYNFEISFEQPEQFSSFVGDVRFVFAYRSTGWALQELGYRLGLFGLSLAMMIWYIVSLRHFKWNEWILEQKWTLFLLLAVLCLDNPVYPLELVAIGWFFPFFNVVLMMTFICMLLMFVLIMLDGVVNPDGQSHRFVTFYLPKIILLGVLFALLVGLFTWQNIHEENDPVYSALNSEGAFIFLLVAIAVILVIYILWIVYLTFRNISTAIKTHTVRRAFIFFGLTTLFTLVVLIVGILYGAIGATIYNGALIMTLYSLMNAYVWCQAFMYMPSKHAVPGEPAAAAGVEHHHAEIAQHDDGGDDGSDNEGGYKEEVVVTPDAVTATLPAGAVVQDL
eukprot:TRINITY_DN15050_c0_g1_i1.p1 TRINITY_DN15050_c0_g1~~TRINITY_DN15050_c0_g1_i1.p1  ORF type:complete len:493 (-),score=83.36 TRINITY_DN15050_c0_g1_i1:103-1581(-)